ncbi:MAG: glycosyltransferase family 39 protein [Elusimicrobiota bacterium]
MKNQRFFRYFLFPVLFGSAALAARLVGIMWGLPNIFNGDEPHLVNLALSFGGGSLRPYAFKYPTLWPYLLFFCYGIYFLIWSHMGRARGIGAFAALYAWHPTGFYLIGRVLSAGFGFAGLFAIWKMERELRGKDGWIWAPALLAFSPTLVELSHSCKPDCMMFFFACLAWLWTLRLFRDGSRPAYWFCGIFFGLAFSTQYTVLPAALALPLAHFLSPARARLRRLGEGCACAAGGFLLGSPYALLDFKNFRRWTGMYSPQSLALRGSWSRASVAWDVAKNIWHFSAPGFLSGAALAFGFYILFREKARLTLVFSLPLAVYIFVLSANPDGGWQRYLLGAFPALAVLAGYSFDALADRIGFGATFLAFLVAVFPGAAQCAKMDRDMRLPDTRQECQAWIDKNVPYGRAILLDEEDDSPRLAMSRDEAAWLARKTRNTGSPRYRLYQAMADHHPGGGYWIYRFKRSAGDLGTYPMQVALSQADAPMVDISAGIAGAMKAGIGYVVTSSMGATPERSPELALFFRQLRISSATVAVFYPRPGKVAGPVLTIYRLNSRE